MLADEGLTNQLGGEHIPLTSDSGDDQIIGLMI
jgi:hypothetical protein